MSKSSFIFCDACNPKELSTENNTTLYKRRMSDSRAWCKGDEYDARLKGWISADAGRHLCPNCQQNILIAERADEKKMSSEHLVRLVHKNNSLSRFITNLSKLK